MPKVPEASSAKKLSNKRRLGGSSPVLARKTGRNSIRQEGAPVSSDSPVEVKKKIGQKLTEGPFTPAGGSKFQNNRAKSGTGFLAPPDSESSGVSPLQQEDRALRERSIDFGRFSSIFNEPSSGVDAGMYFGLSDTFDYMGGVRSSLDKYVNGLSSRKQSTVLSTLELLNDYLNLHGEEAVLGLSTGSKLYSLLRDHLRLNACPETLDRRMVLCAQILSTMIDLTPNFASRVISKTDGLMEVIIGHIREMRCLEVADQCVVILSRLCKNEQGPSVRYIFFSPQQGHALVSALLSSLEFFCVSTQRQCMQIVTEVMGVLVSSIEGTSVSVVSIFSQLTALLSHPDKMIGDKIADCWTTIVQCLVANPVKGSELEIDPASIQQLLTSGIWLKEKIMSGMARLSRTSDTVALTVLDCAFDRLIEQLQGVSSVSLLRLCTSVFPALVFEENGKGLVSLDGSSRLRAMEKDSRSTTLLNLCMRLAVEMSLSKTVDAVPVAVQLVLVGLLSGRSDVEIGEDERVVRLMAFVLKTTGRCVPTLVASVKVVLLMLEKRPSCAQLMKRHGILDHLQSLLKRDALSKNLKTAMRNCIRRLGKPEVSKGNYSGVSASLDWISHLGLLNPFELGRSCSGLSELVRSPERLNGFTADLVSRRDTLGSLDSFQNLLTSLSTLVEDELVNRLASEDCTVSDECFKQLITIPLSVTINGKIRTLVNALSPVGSLEMLADRWADDGWDDDDDCSDDTGELDDIEDHIEDHSVSEDSSSSVENYSDFQESPYAPSHSTTNLSPLKSLFSPALYVNDRLVDLSLMEGSATSLLRAVLQLRPTDPAAREKSFFSSVGQGDLFSLAADQRRAQLSLNESLLKSALQNSKLSLQFGNNVQERTDRPMNNNVVNVSSISADLIDEPQYAQPSIEECALLGALCKSTCVSPSALDALLLLKVLLRVVSPSLAEKPPQMHRLDSLLQPFLSSAYTAWGKGIPEWLSFIVDALPEVLSFSTRKKLFCVQFLRDLLQTDRQKVKVHRDGDLVKAACVVMNAFTRGGQSPILEFEFSGEAGSGSGPTNEFYSLVADRLRNGRCCRVAADGGLFPALMHVSENEWVEFLKKIHLMKYNENMTSCPPAVSQLDLWRLMGHMAARALVDKRQVDLDFSPLFWKLVKLIGERIRGLPGQSRAIPVCAQWLQVVDPQLHTSLQQLAGMTEEQANTTMIDVSTVPGHESWATGTSQISDFVNKVVSINLFDGIKPQLAAFAMAFSEVLNIDELSLFLDSEISQLIGGSTGSYVWSVPSLFEAIVPDHGYTSSSATFKDFIEVLVEMSCEEKTRFVQFITGSKNLPAEGFAGLNPALTVVKVHEENGDCLLPSVMTCAHFLKLPEYGSKEILREKLLLAVNEGQSSFLLS